MLKIKHVPMQLFDVTVFPIMFTLLFTYLFGGALAGSPSEYLQFLLPGILVMTVTMITMYTGMALNTDIGKGIFDRFRSLPIWRPAVLVGMLLADTVRYTIASVGGDRPRHRPRLPARRRRRSACCRRWPCCWSSPSASRGCGRRSACKMQTPESVMQVSMTMLFPLTFASNVFVDPATMPGWVQAFVEVNPITHLTTASRSLMHGSGGGGEIVWVLAVERRAGGHLRPDDHAPLRQGAVASGPQAEDFGAKAARAADEPTPARSQKP